jgi:hypothetical protein
MEPPKCLQRAVTYLVMALAILTLDLFTGRYLLFPILFIIPVILSAWCYSARWAYVMAVLLPIFRLLIALYEKHSDPAVFIVINAAIRVVVLLLMAFLVARTARQNRELKKQLSGLVTICAWSRTVEYQGEWISFEEYLKRRFGITSSHGISPGELDKMISEIQGPTDSSAAAPPKD